MVKRELPPSTGGEEPKPKRKSGKKHGTPAPVPSKEADCFQAVLTQSQLPPPGSAVVAAKSSTPIKQEPGVVPAAQVKPPTKSGKVKDDASSRKKAASKAPLRQSAPTAAATSIPAIASASIAAAVGSVKPKRFRKLEKQIAAAHRESSEEDSDEDSDEDENEAAESSGDEEDEEDVEAQMETAAGLEVDTPAADAIVQSLLATQPSDLNRNIGSFLPGCSEEAEIYLYNLVHLPITSSVIMSALREMVVQWLKSDFDTETVRGACRDPNIVEQLRARGATPARLGELSHLLQVVDPLENLACWVQSKVKSPEELRRLCTLLVPSSLDPRTEARMLPSVSYSGDPRTTTQSQPQPTKVKDHCEPTGNEAVRHSMFPPPSRSKSHSYVPGSRSPACDERPGRTGAAAPHWPELPVRSHSNGRSQAVSVPYVRPGDAHKVLLFIVGTPDTTLTDASYNAHDFRSACEKAYGAGCVEKIGRYSNQIWRVAFRSYLPDYPLKPVEYYNSTMHPEEALRTPTCFFSDISSFSVPDSTIFDCIASMFQRQPGTIYRLEQGGKTYIIVQFRRAPHLLRFYVPLPSNSAAEYMPAFRPCQHRDRPCSLCQTQHGETVCPRARCLEP